MPAQANPESLKSLRDFGRKLAEKRMEAGVERQKFAEKCGISYKHYFNIENGVERPSLLTYISICRALGINLPMVG
jgi:DNA-binding XRE family transcriptional regulator